MLKTIISFGLILFNFVVFGQNFRLKIFVTDNLQRKDSIEFGFQENSAVGIDTILGEKNIYGTEYDSLEIRVIHRTENEFNCLYYLGEPIYFEENIDTKIDLRPFNDDFSSINNNFEFIIKGVEYPFILTADFSEIPYIYGGWSYIIPRDINCIKYDQISLLSNVDTIFLISDSTIQTCTIAIQSEVGINEQFQNSIFSIFPNPAQNKLTIRKNLLISKDYNVLIFRMDGKIVLKSKINNENELLDLTGISAGIYILIIENEELQLFYKMIKMQ